MDAEDLRERMRAAGLILTSKVAGKAVKYVLELGFGPFRMIALPTEDWTWP